MSRFYHLHVRVKGISGHQLEDTMSALGWSVSVRDDISEDISGCTSGCTFEGNLYGG